MKHKGSKSDFIAERDSEMLEAWKKQCSQRSSLGWDLEALAATASSPSSRFWVSEHRAAIVIAAMRREEKMRLVRRQAAECASMLPALDDPRRSAKRELMLRRVREGSPILPDSEATQSAAGEETTNATPPVSSGETGGGWECLAGMLPQRRRMYEEIYRRCRRLWQEEGVESVMEAVVRVVVMEAPSFYVSASGLRKILIRERRRRRTARGQRPRFNRS